MWMPADAGEIAAGPVLCQRTGQGSRHMPQRSSVSASAAPVRRPVRGMCGHSPEAQRCMNIRCGRLSWRALTGTAMKPTVQSALDNRVRARLISAEFPFQVRGKCSAGTEVVCAAFLVALRPVRVDYARTSASSVPTDQGDGWLIGLTASRTWPAVISETGSATRRCQDTSPGSRCTRCPRSTSFAFG
jgi:hypothetical protein